MFYLLKKEQPIFDRKSEGGKLFSEDRYELHLIPQIKEEDRLLGIVKFIKIKVLVDNKHITDVKI